MSSAWRYFLARLVIGPDCTRIIGPYRKPPRSLEVGAKTKVGEEDIPHELGWVFRVASSMLMSFAML